MPAIASSGVRPILNTALLLTAVAMVVRAAGAVKEVLFAGAFGVSADTDAFVLAVTYATFLPTVIGSAVATALIAERAKARADAEANLNALAWWVFAAAATCGIAVYALAPVAMSVLFTVSGETLSTAISYARTLSPLGFAMVLSLAMCGLLNSEKQFYVAGMSAFATPVFTMGAIVLFASTWGVQAAAWGMVVGGLAEVVLLTLRILP
ncbi:MAG TPA: lipid II flippase MurJ, partial [Burkholderiales bacterium]|nr:lipid II flippase MurJ [Burkholderiales bacterium]